MGGFYCFFVYFFFIGSRLCVFCLGLIKCYFKAESNWNYAKSVFFQMTACWGEVPLFRKHQVSVWGFFACLLSSGQVVWCV